MPFAGTSENGTNVRYQELERKPVDEQTHTSIGIAIYQNQDVWGIYLSIYFFTIVSLGQVTGTRPRSPHHSTQGLRPDIIHLLLLPLISFFFSSSPFPAPAPTPAPAPAPAPHPVTRGTSTWMAGPTRYFEWFFHLLPRSFGICWSSKYWMRVSWWTSTLKAWQNSNLNFNFI